MEVAKSQKAQYSENEAAAQLGVSVDQLRVLVKRHIIRTEDEIPLIPVASFQPADLLLLRFLAGQSAQAN